MNLAHRIELWPIDRLKPYDRNARTHSPEQVTKIAASLAEFGFTNPILVDSADGIIAGHGRLLAARKLGLSEVPVIVLDYLTDAQRRAYILADNKLAEAAGWDVDLLAAELGDLDAEGFDLGSAGFSEEEIAALCGDGLLPAGDLGQAGPGVERTAPTAEQQAAAAHTEQQQTPEGVDDEVESPRVPVSRTGDIWILGRHRVMCGDSTNARDVSMLMTGKKATLMHADPPYGMGKEAEGVANDNLRGKELDGFHLDWWGAFRPHLTPNASAYIWGNAPALWRLWYAAGLGDTEPLEMRNEIVWDKGNGSGQRDPGMSMYPPISERCLFFQIGQQFLGSVNSDEFPADWEPVRKYLADQAMAAGITPSDVLRVCGVGMYSHWFTRSQFTLMPEKHYVALGIAYPVNFQRPWRDIKSEWDAVKTGPQSIIQQSRSYFDNTHDAMTDVWKFQRVTGEERHGHATPKPVAMMERIMKSSTRPGDIVVEPFGGSGSTLIGCETTGRACYTMELQSHYVDVIALRWAKVSGGIPILESTGQTFDEVAQARAPDNDNVEADVAAA